MTREFLEFCVENHIDLILRTPNCSTVEQFEDLVSFCESARTQGRFHEFPIQLKVLACVVFAGELKNHKDIGWYKLKMLSVPVKLARTGSPNLSFKEMLKLLVPSWNNAFSKEVNRRSWEAGGFGPDGITMAPLWKQKKKQEGIGVSKRARSHAERRRNAIVSMGLNKATNFDALKAPWDRDFRDLAKDDDEENWEDGDDSLVQQAVKTTRSFSAELQKLGVPGTSNPALLIRDFYEDIARLSQLAFRPITVQPSSV